MRYRARSLFRRFRKEESGNASVEFVIVVPLFIMLMMMSIELGFVTLRHMLLERGLDIAVRQIRLGTGNPDTHDQIKQVICDSAGFLLDCETQLRLEMQPVDLRSYSTLDEAAKCIENSEPVDPIKLSKEFNPGTANDLMVLRACYRYDPIFPKALLGNALQKDEHGKSSIITMTAFVQEPT